MSNPIVSIRCQQCGSQAQINLPDQPAEQVTCPACGNQIEEIESESMRTIDSIHQSYKNDEIDEAEMEAKLETVLDKTIAEVDV